MRPALGSGLPFLLGFGLSDAIDRDDVFLVAVSNRSSIVWDAVWRSSTSRSPVFHISVAQSAWLLGYEGPTFFNHAFGRWTGRTASDARGGVQRSKMRSGAQAGSSAIRSSLRLGPETPVYIPSPAQLTVVLM
jgi:hypothetical protein